MSCLQAKQLLAERCLRQDRTQALLDWHKVRRSFKSRRLCSSSPAALVTPGTHAYHLIHVFDRSPSQLSMMSTYIQYETVQRTDSIITHALSTHV